MEDPNRMKKIKRVSAVLKWIATAFIFLFPILNVAEWIMGGLPDLLGLKISMIPKIPVPSALSTDFPASLENSSSTAKFLCFLVSLIPVGFASLTFFWLRSLFHHFQKMEIFTADSVRCISNVGWTLLIAQICTPFTEALMTLVLTFSNPPGHRLIAISLGPIGLGFVAIAIVILLISWVMEEGRRLKEESEGTV